MELPVKYSEISSYKRRKVREEYVKLQEGKCFYCGEDLIEEPPYEVLVKPIHLELFPPNFLKYPIHLQHNHDTDFTEGAVHAYCNAVMWEYEGR